MEESERGGGVRRMKFVYRKGFRNTGMGGVDYFIAYCLTCQRVIEPKMKYRSRAGTHGEDIFVHEHPLAFIHLYSSNSGKRKVTIEGQVPFEIERKAKELWLLKAATVSEVKAALAGEEK